MGKRRRRMQESVKGRGLGSYKGTLAALLLVWCLDIGANVSLFLRTKDWCKHGDCKLTPEQLLDGLGSSFGSKTDVLDLSAMLLVRIAIGVAGWLMSLRVTRHLNYKDAAPATKVSHGHGGSINDDDGGDVDLESQPLLGASSDLPDETDPTEETAKVHSAAADTDAKNRLSRRKLQIVGSIFFFLTSIQAYVGVKCVSFHFADELSSVLMCISVLLINIEIYLLKNLIDIITKDEGVRMESIHNHPIFYVKQLPLHNCDLCQDKIKAGAYRCKSCDFDCCVKCFLKKDISKAEGQVRGDKGLKNVEEVKTSAYAWRAIGFCRPHWYYIAIAVVCLLLNIGVSLLMPNYQGHIIDCIVERDHARFKYVMTIFVILSAASGLFGSIRQLMFRIVGSKMANSIRNRLFARVVAQDIAFYDGNRTGDLVSRLSGDVGALVAPAQSMIGTLLTSILQLAGGIVLCFHTSWRLSMLAFVTIAPIMYLTDQYARWSRKLSYEYWSALGDATAKANETLNNIRTVKAFSTEKAEAASYEVSTKEALSKAIIDAIGGAATFSVTNYLDLGGTVLILWYGGSLALQGDISVGTLVAFRMYWMMINTSYKSFMNVLTSFTRAGGAAQRVLSLLDNCPDIDAEVGEEITFQGEVELQDVEFHYQMRPDNKVLKGINLKIRRGEVCALVGRSGGGKSTIAHLLMRFYDPKGGRILLDGKDFTTLNLKNIHDQCGLVAQETQLFGWSIKENICYGLKDKFDTGELTDADVIDAAQAANAHEFILKFEDGYETKVGERGIRLSGGQKQRIALARVFLRKPKLLVLDEATSALDAESEHQVQEALDRLIAMGNSTVLLIAHRLSTVMDADKIAVVNDGAIVETGKHAELVAQGGIYAKLVARQLERAANQLDESGIPSDNIDTLLEEEEGREQEAEEGRGSDQAGVKGAVEKKTV